MGKKDKKQELHDLKQEVKMDEHIVPIEELVARLGTNLETVGVSLNLKIVISDCVSFDFEG